MSHSLSPAILHRVRTFADEMAALAQLLAYLEDLAGARLDANVFIEIRLGLERHGRALLEGLGGPPDDDRDLYPLPKAEPHMLPVSLCRVAELAHRAVPVLHALGVSAGDDERLAAEYLAARLFELGKTAGFIRDTLVEELPPLQKGYEAIAAGASV